MLAPPRVCTLAGRPGPLGASTQLEQLEQSRVGQGRENEGEIEIFLSSRARFLRWEAGFYFILLFVFSDRGWEAGDLFRAVAAPCFDTPV